ncbi:MAG TPA: hypothetical protein VK324_17545, partial [Tepidisphaeraceae bacterium]|nr:hypothetical protein [Tepidisphaeraceae bacterium]
NPADGQLYVTGLKGWQTTAARDGAVQRVRYTGKPLVMPIGLKADADGLAVTFSAPLDKEAAVDADNYAAERWNYLWSSAYGSPQVSVEDPKRRERDPVDIEAAAVSDDGRTVTLKVADMKPAMQYKVQLDGKAADGTAFEWTLYNTVNTTGPDSKPPGVMPAEIKPPDADRIAR